MRSVAKIVLMTCAAAVAAASCAPAPIGDYPEGSDTKLPDRRSKTDDAGGSGNNPDGVDPTDPVVPSKPTLTVTLKGGGTVTSTPNGVTCTGTTCTGTFDKGTKVTLVPKPEAGSLFAGWTGGCTGAGVCEPTLNADMNVSADFQTLDGTWTGTYSQVRQAVGCTFTNAGTWSTTFTSNAGALTSTTTTGSGFELRQPSNNCNLVASNNGTAPSTNVTITNGTFTGTWVMSIQGASGTLDMPFTATIAGNKLTGSWTCATCTGSITLTKQ